MTGEGMEPEAAGGRKFGRNAGLRDGGCAEVFHVSEAGAASPGLEWPSNGLRHVLEGPMGAGKGREGEEGVVLGAGMEMERWEGLRQFWTVAGVGQGEDGGSYSRPACCSALRREKSAEVRMGMWRGEERKKG